MEEILEHSNFKLPEIVSGKLNKDAIYITPEGSKKVVPATWGYLPVGLDNEESLLTGREKIYKVDYLNLKNLPFANHEQAGYCKVWIWDGSKPRAVRGFYFHDLEKSSYTACLVTDNSNLLYI